MSLAPAVLTWAQWVCVACGDVESTTALSLQNRSEKRQSNHRTTECTSTSASPRTESRKSALKSASSGRIVVRSSDRSSWLGPRMAPAGTLLTTGRRSARSCACRRNGAMLKPYTWRGLKALWSQEPDKNLLARPLDLTLFQKSSSVASSEPRATKILAISGRTAPPGFSHLSLAWSTVSNIVSKRSAYPIHSDTITSTLGAGRPGSSSTLPARILTRSVSPLASTFCGRGAHSAGPALAGVVGPLYMCTDRPPKVGIQTRRARQPTHLPGQTGHVVATIYPDDGSRPGPSRKHTEDPRATADVEDYAVMEQRWVVLECLAVGFGPRLIPEHLPVDPQMTAESDTARVEEANRHMLRNDKTHLYESK